MLNYASPALKLQCAMLGLKIFDTLVLISPGSDNNFVLCTADVLSYLAL